VARHLESGKRYNVARLAYALGSMIWTRSSGLSCCSGCRKTTVILEKPPDAAQLQLQRVTNGFIQKA